MRGRKCSFVRSINRSIYGHFVLGLIDKVAIPLAGRRRVNNEWVHGGNGEWMSEMRVAWRARKESLPLGNFVDKKVTPHSGSR